MSKQTPDLEGFEATYRKHVTMVVDGDLNGVMADMLPAALPTVFDGVSVPRGDVTSAEVVRVSLDGDRGVGEAVYETPAGSIGLRSEWLFDGEGWKADALENFDPPSGTA